MTGMPYYAMRRGTTNTVKAGDYEFRYLLFSEGRYSNCAFKTLCPIARRAGWLFLLHVEHQAFAVRVGAWAPATVLAIHLSGA